jgi:hypothetical protein
MDQLADFELSLAAAVAANAALSHRAMAYDDAITAYQRAITMLHDAATATATPSSDNGNHVSLIGSYTMSLARVQMDAQLTRDAASSYQHAATIITNMSHRCESLYALYMAGKLRAVMHQVIALLPNCMVILMCYSVLKNGKKVKSYCVNV